MFGCGPIGLLLVQLLRLAGAEVFAADPLAHRQAAAEALGASAEPREVDVAFEVAGNDDAARRGARGGAAGWAASSSSGIPDGDRTSFSASARTAEGPDDAAQPPDDAARPAARDRARRGRRASRSRGSSRNGTPVASGAEAFAALSERRGLKVVIEPNA